MIKDVIDEGNLIRQFGINLVVGTVTNGIFTGFGEDDAVNIGQFIRVQLQHVETQFRYVNFRSKIVLEILHWNDVLASQWLKTT